MPPFSLLLLPLIGGFIFASKWYPLRYYTLRADNYRFVFTASASGAAFLFLACLLVNVASYWFPSFCRIVDYRWHLVVPLESSGRAVLGALLGAITWWPVNRLSTNDNLLRWLGEDGRPFGWLANWIAGNLSDEAAVNRAIARKGDPIELILRRVLTTKRLISVSVKSGKTYIGYLTMNFNPAFPMESISFLPSYSGHRDKDTQQMVLDLDYSNAYKGIQADLERKLLEELKNTLKNDPDASEDEVYEGVMHRLNEAEGLQNYEIVVPIEEIQSVNMFDVDVYLKHFGGGTYNLADARTASTSSIIVTSNANLPTT